MPRLSALAAIVFLPLTLAAGSVGPASPSGAQPQLDFPTELQRRNTESKGLGLCVFTSIHHASVFQDTWATQEFPKWIKDHGIAGGGYPQKVDSLIKQIAADRKVPVPDYVQVEGKDLEILRLACRTGRMPCVTYSYSCTGRYGGQRIAHMVNLVNADAQWFTILDNNYPGQSNYEWDSPAEFSRAYADGWSVIFLDEPPPPVPTPAKE